MVLLIPSYTVDIISCQDLLFGVSFCIWGGRGTVLGGWMEGSQTLLANGDINCLNMSLVLLDHSGWHFVLLF